MNSGNEAGVNRAIGVMWIAVGSVQLLTGVWAIAASILAGIVIAASATRPAVPGVTTYLGAFMAGAAVQSGLAGLVVYAAIECLRSRERGPSLLVRLSWWSLGFYWTIAAVGAAFVVTVTASRAPEAALSFRVGALGGLVAIAVVMSIPCAVTIAKIRSVSANAEAEASE